MTIKEIAKLAGVSVATVSRVINNTGSVKPETTEKIKEIIKEINYVPNSLARSLSTKKSDTIGVVFPNINNPFFGEIIKGITMEADKFGLQIIFLDTCNSFQKERDALLTLRKHQIAGLIMTPLNENKAEIYNDVLGSLNVPVVMVDRENKKLPCDGVFLANELAAYNLTSLLTKNGHKNIGMICCPHDTKPGRERLDGYKLALQSSKIDYDKEKVFFGDFTWDSGYNITKDILENHKDITGVFIANNMMTVGAIKAIKEAGLSIPEDISIVAFDDVEILSILGIGMTCAYSPTQDMGINAVQMLYEKINSKEQSTEPEKRTLLPEIIDRGTHVFPKNRK